MKTFAHLYVETMISFFRTFYGKLWLVLMVFTLVSAFVRDDEYGPIVDVTSHVEFPYGDGLDCSSFTHAGGQV